jgi:hypothetical protein
LFAAGAAVILFDAGAGLFAAGATVILFDAGASLFTAGTAVVLFGAGSDFFDGGAAWLPRGAWFSSSEISISSLFLRSREAVAFVVDANAEVLVEEVAAALVAGAEGACFRFDVSLTGTSGHEVDLCWFISVCLGAPSELVREGC